jgi:hypothetical protein
MAPRRGPASIAFLVVWLVLWAGAIFIAVHTLGGAVLEGGIVPAVLLAVWIAVAALACYRVGRRLVTSGEPKAVRRREPSGRHAWRDDMPEGR